MPTTDVEEKQMNYVKKSLDEGMALMDEITEFTKELKAKKFVGNATTSRVTLIGKKVDLINEGVRSSFRRS